MNFLFRKTFKIGPINLSISKTGVGISLGKGGVRIGANTNGRKQISASIPGTGITIRKSLSLKKGNAK